MLLTSGEVDQLTSGCYGEVLMGNVNSGYITNLNAEAKNICWREQSRSESIFCRQRALIVEHHVVRTLMVMTLAKIVHLLVGLKP